MELSKEVLSQKTMGKSSSNQGTALGIGIGTILCAIFAMNSEGENRPTAVLRPPPEIVRITFVGQASTIVVATETTEYVHCDPEVQNNVSHCVTRVPGPAVSITIVLPLKDHVTCRSQSPMVTVDHGLLVSRFKESSIHAGSLCCEYDLIRTPPLLSTPPL